MASGSRRLSLLVGRQWLRRVLQNPAFGAGLAYCEAAAAAREPLPPRGERMKVGHHTVLVLLSSSFRFRVVEVSKIRENFSYLRNL